MAIDWAYFSTTHWTMYLDIVMRRKHVLFKKNKVSYLCTNKNIMPWRIRYFISYQYFVTYLDTVMRRKHVLFEKQSVIFMYKKNIMPWHFRYFISYQYFVTLFLISKANRLELPHQDNRRCCVGYLNNLPRYIERVLPTTPPRACNYRNSLELAESVCKNRNEMWNLNSNINNNS